MPLFQKSMYILLAVIAVTVGATLYDNYRSEAPIILAEKGAEFEEDGALIVYVTGAVKSPGMVTVEQGARTAEAVEICGGVLPTADTAKVNLAEVLTDGAHIHVPERVEVSGRTAAATETSNAKADNVVTAQNKSAAGTNMLVNINTADEKELDTLPGIGPVMAKRIIEFRQNVGKFTAPSDIKKVKGIGEAKYEKLKDLITT